MLRSPKGWRGTGTDSSLAWTGRSSWRDTNGSVAIFGETATGRICALAVLLISAEAVRPGTGATDTAKWAADAAITEPEAAGGSGVPGAIDFLLQLWQAVGREGAVAGARTASAQGSYYEVVPTPAYFTPCMHRASNWNVRDNYVSVLTQVLPTYRLRIG